MFNFIKVCILFYMIVLLVVSLVVVGMVFFFIIQIDNECVIECNVQVVVIGFGFIINEWVVVCIVMMVVVVEGVQGVDLVFVIKLL